jgi:ketosteroid isomerase-like protein
MEALKVAIEAGDVQKLTALLAEDVVVQSPITTLIRFEGKDQVRELFEHVFRHIQDVRFSQSLSDGDKMHAIFWRGRVGKYSLEEANLVRLTTKGQIAEMTVLPEGLATDPLVARVCTTPAPHSR